MAAVIDAGLVLPQTTATDADASKVPARSRWWPAALLVWAGIWLAFFLANLGLVERLEFRDPDDELRLQQVRDLLSGQGWFDLHQYRVDALDGGVLMHWSRLVDLPIAGVILLLRPLLGASGAEQAALILVPALTLLAIVLAIGWMAARVLPGAARLPAMACLAFAAPVMLQLLPLRIDHHGWQIALMLAAVAACLDPHQRRGGALSGAALAAWMAISFEGLPFSAWFVAVLGIMALLDPGQRPRVTATVQSLAAGSALLFLATRGLGDLTQRCDAVAPVHLAIFAWAAVAVTAAARWAPASRVSLVAGFAAAGGGALALVATTAPQCFTGSFDMLDPVVRALWYDNVAEGKPLFQADWPVIAQYALPPLIALGVTIRLVRETAGEARVWWLRYALLLGGALAIALAVTRASAIAGALAVLPLGWLVANRMGGLKRPDNLLLRLGELTGTAALIFVLLVPAVPVAAIEKLVADPATATPDRGTQIACTAAKARDALAALPPAGVLAPLDFGPNLLIHSPLTVLATGHHRGATAMRGVIDAFSGTDAEARAVMDRYDLRYVVVCPGVQEMDLYRKRAPAGFAAQLLDGRAPAWLLPVSLPQAAGFRMWQRRDAAPPMAAPVRPVGRSAPPR